MNLDIIESRKTTAGSSVQTLKQIEHFLRNIFLDGSLIDGAQRGTEIGALIRHGTRPGCPLFSRSAFHLNRFVRLVFRIFVHCFRCAPLFVDHFGLSAADKLTHVI